MEFSLNQLKYELKTPLIIVNYEENDLLDIYLTAALWLLLAIISTILANRLKISITLMEITIGALFGYVAYKFDFFDKLEINSDWLQFISGSGVILLTFLAGTELDPFTLKQKLKEISGIGIFGFFVPFTGSFLLSYFILGWEFQSSLLAGITLSTASMAVVYAVMLENGLNTTEFGKSIIGACFINNLVAVIGLGLLFTPFTYRTVIFILVCLILIKLLPTITVYLTKEFGNKTAAIRTKWILFLLFGFGALALWSGSEPVLPAYIAGMVLAGTISKDNSFIGRLRTLTIGFLTPFYFLRAGALMSIPVVISAPITFLILMSGKVVFKIFGIFPVISRFREDRKEKWYYSLLMSAGLAFGIISAQFGLTHGILTNEQYSFLVAVVITSAVIPTLIANSFFLPKHLLRKTINEEELP
ncbi:MAG: conserved rane protein of unknown function [Ignavibacteria bacterium]|nr:conserved rane protein of unknown function [Ignavibacteria bacterium]